MDSEKTQRSQKKEKVGANLEAEFVPMETTKKKANKNVVVMEKTACAFVLDLKKKVLDHLEANSR